ncbi:MAG: S1 RNA-binding domain-containing protein [Gemmatimonas sp.]|nr:S1 RNA-binding domain-containing protein [Gemmatimonas sp.]
MQQYAQLIAVELALQPSQVRATLDLLGDGNTIPFVARYRKEATGELDEVQIRDIRDRFEYLSELDDRRATVLASIEDQGRLTPELKARIEAASTKAELEDLYRPFKPKRRTRATMAIERGLDTLAELLFAGATSEAELRRLAEGAVDPDRGVDSAEDALGGARDIVAERIAEDVETRAFVRDLTRRKGSLESKAARGKEGETTKFSDYYAFSEPIRSIPSHRVLAVRRGEADGVLTARVAAPEDEILGGLHTRYVAQSRAPEQMEQVIADSYRRLIAPSVEVELRMELKNQADEEAIQIFGQNLEGLLLAPPAGGRTTLGIDPGFRTGCKLAVVSRTGALLDTGILYLHHEERARAEVIRLVQRHGVELVAVGNGTASRETDRLVRDALKEVPTDRRPIAALVNEAGASVYSASDLARAELPDLDLTVRSAVSIARRIQDPLAELVKIDPKAIGVGQYQHDVPQPKLKRRLDEAVESCVNRVGVEVNTASPALLSYVAGIGPTVAQRIVEHRDSTGSFRSRREVLGVSGVGAKTFEQSAGFLRIIDGSHPLDRSAVHPERYRLVERMANDRGLDLPELIGNDAAISGIEPSRYVDDDVGLPTLLDILDELRKPGRDPREAFEAPEFREDVNEIGDLEVGMSLQGTVTNVVAFGAFVDVGVHQDGLVHVSQLADRFVKDSSDVVSVGDRVTVRVVSVDLERRRIGLTMRSDSDDSARRGAGKAVGKGKGSTKTSPSQTPRIEEGLAANGMRIRRG